MRTVRLAPVAVLAMLTTVLVGSHGTAFAHPDAGAPTGTITIDPMWAPGAGPAMSAGWSFASVFPSLETMSGSGTLDGHCGAATGTGTATFESLSTHTMDISLTWAGATIVFSGWSGTDLVSGVLHARPVPTEGQGPCVLYPATLVTVVGEWTVSPGFFDADAGAPTGTLLTGSMFAPGLGNSAFVGWSFSSSAPGIGSMTGSGTFDGWCGQAVGRGQLSLTNSTTHTADVVLTWSGTTITFVGSNGPHLLSGTLEVAPDPLTPPGACIAFGSTRWAAAGAWTAT